MKNIAPILGKLYQVKISFWAWYSKHNLQNILIPIDQVLLFVRQKECDDGRTNYYFLYNNKIVWIRYSPKRLQQHFCMEIIS